jgi:hypothetical protein
MPNANEVDKFVDVLSLNYNFLFGDAVYSINKNREVKLRKPEEMPSETDVKTVREYTLTRNVFVARGPVQEI